LGVSANVFDAFRFPLFDQHFLGTGASGGGDAFEMRIHAHHRLPLSPQAKRVMLRARKEMRRLGDDYLGTEHVLLGIVCNEDGTAVRMLAGMGVSPEPLEDRLYELRGRAAS
jgi:ATP-dependent Clp protease ATP-binding subunit ClpA